MTYRYVTRQADWDDPNDFYHLTVYVKKNFRSVLLTSSTLYFNAGPKALRDACDKLGLPTMYIDILTTSDLEPHTES